jgi:hypothetical protein
MVVLHGLRRFDLGPTCLMCRLPEVASCYTFPDMTDLITFVIVTTMIIISFAFGRRLYAFSSARSVIFLYLQHRILLPYLKPFPYMGIQSSVN